MATAACWHLRASPCRHGVDRARVGGCFDSVELECRACAGRNVLGGAWHASKVPCSAHNCLFGTACAAYGLCLQDHIGPDWSGQKILPHYISGWSDAGCLMP